MSMRKFILFIPYVLSLVASDSGCGGTVELVKSGLISSPNYPNNYNDNVKCTWTLKAPEGKRIQVTVTDFDLEEENDNSNCWDWLEIDNDKTVHCGKDEIPEFTTCTNIHTVVFKSDDSHNRKGFQAKLEVVEPTCQSELTLSFIEDEADNLNIRANYSGKYLSTLAVEDKSKRPFWVHDQRAIWWKDNAWRIGSLANKGTDKADIVSLTPTACPHTPDPSECPTSTNPITWKYKVTEKSEESEENWKNAEEDGVLSLPDECTSACRKAKAGFDKAIDNFVEVSEDENNKKIEKNTNIVKELKGVLKKGGAIGTIVGNLFDQLENLKDPKTFIDALDTEIDAAFDSGKLSPSRKEELKKSLKESFKFDGKNLATKKDITNKMKSKIALEIARTEKENGGLKTMKQRVKFFSSETKRRVKGMSKTRMLVKGAKASSMMTGMIGKFVAAAESDDPAEIALNTMSGILDLSSAIAVFLPPPASIITDTFSGILGLFMPGAGGPSNQDIMDEITEGFAEQKKLILNEFAKQNKMIKHEFAEQTKFIKKKFEQTVLAIKDGTKDIKNLISKEKFNKIKKQSFAVLDYINEKQAYLNEIQADNALTPHELTRVTSDLQLMDNTKDTSFIRQTLVDDCLGIFKETPLYEESDQVQYCLLILYNYLTIEKNRDLILVRFLTLRNLEPQTTDVTKSYWAVREKRKEVLEEFIGKIEANTGGNDHQGFTGLKIQCYIAGAGETEIYTKNVLEVKRRDEIREYIHAIKRESFMTPQTRDSQDTLESSKPCQELTEKVPFLPTGPQSMVSLEHVNRAMKQPMSPNRQWEQCHKQSFKTSLYSDNYPRAVAGVIYKALGIPGTEVDIGSIKNKCTKQKVIMACKRVGTRTLDAMSMGARNNVFGFTDKEKCGQANPLKVDCGSGIGQCLAPKWNQCNGLDEDLDTDQQGEGTRWYMIGSDISNTRAPELDQGGWGFVPANKGVGFLSDRTLRYGTNVRSKGPWLDKMRTDGWFGGNYCGKKITFTQSDKSKYELVFYHAD